MKQGTKFLKQSRPYSTNLSPTVATTIACVQSRAYRLVDVQHSFVASPPKTKFHYQSFAKKWPSSASLKVMNVHAKHHVCLVHIRYHVHCLVSTIRERETKHALTVSHPTYSPILLLSWHELCITMYDDRAIFVRKSFQVGSCCRGLLIVTHKQTWCNVGLPIEFG